MRKHLLCNIVYLTIAFIFLRSECVALPSLTESSVYEFSGLSVSFINVQVYNSGTAT